MTMNIEIISKEKIKPSSSTPNHLRNFKLCLLDQLIPAPYAPILLFYPNSDSSTNSQVLKRLLVLKKSLSEILSRFYPLAGTIKDDLSIDCDDQGAYYITARIKSHLFDFLEHPEIRLINRFLPLEGTSVTNIQVNVFECGGIAIGVCISHKILDGTALSMFLKGWADAAFASSKEVVYPDFSASSLFPANDLRLKNDSMAMWGALFKKGQFITKRFVFDGLAIAKLKEMALSSSIGRHPTRVETISAFIWKCTMAASEQKHGSKKPSLITHIVNLRKRAAPKFSEHSLGNLIWMASAECSSVKNKETIELPGLVHQLTKSISKIDADYVKKLRSEEAPLMMYKHFKEIGEFVSNGSADCFGFTSWCKLGFYDADFGWGKPVWVSSMDSSIPFFMNLIILMDTRCGTGIEAWITLDEQEMSILQNNQEFQAFTSLNPSPLNFGHAAMKFSI
ncbi:HXXXD-type acyl-transferase family protein [Forsythia ovata]|uniref:HXXXD-type acyl-transferase family protein n=1 Tax=Forsythia ovata TaxID=205694 RepID=A0ABD1UX87_9LAMI